MRALLMKLVTPLPPKQTSQLLLFTFHCNYSIEFFFCIVISHKVRCGVILFSVNIGFYFDAFGLCILNNY